MSSKANVFISIVVALGTAVAGIGLLHWTLANSGTFAVLFVLCAATSLLRLSLPGMQGSLSVAYIFLICAVTRLSLGQTILMGIASALVQSYWRSKKKPRPVQVIFNIGLICLSTGVSKVAFSSTVSQSLAPGVITRTMLAAVAYYLVNTSCVAAIIAFTEGRPPLQVWRHSYLWTFPHYLLGASLVVGTDMLRNAIGIQGIILLVPVVYLVYHSFQTHMDNLRQAIERAEIDRKHAEATALLHVRTIRALALAIEAKDQTTAAHLHRVQTYAVELGKEFGLSAEGMEALQAAAILHDIGKIAVPEYIISKPGRLTPEEFGKMKIHPIVGAEIIQSINFPFPVSPLVRAHHEKWDGSGYPDGLKGEEIPLGARILTAVDCLDALASDRQYRKAMPLDDAMQIIVQESGRSFDPNVVAALSKRYRELEQLARTTAEASDAGFATEYEVHRGLAPDAGFAAEGMAGSPVESKRAVLELSAIQEIGRQLHRLDSLHHTLAAIQVPLRTLIPFDSFALFLRHDDALQCAYTYGSSGEFLSRHTIPVGSGASGWVATNGKPLLNGNAQTEFVPPAVPPAEFDLRSAIAIPLDSEDGISGVLTLYSRDQSPFTKEHLRLLLAVQSPLAYYLRLNQSGLTGTSLDTAAETDPVRQLASILVT